MTLPCGEQVIPFHEHGVELDGFHEEKTTEDDDDFSASDRRERSACPSGERQVTCIFVKVRQNNKSKENNLVLFSIWIVKMVSLSWRIMEINHYVSVLAIEGESDDIIKSPL